MAVMPDSLYVLLQQAAARVPDHPAVLFRDRQLSYRQLVDDSTRAGALLAEQDARPGRRVAHCFRTAEAPVALFALIRTDATYVPLDPAWPGDRIRTICRDAGIELWVGNVAPSFSIPTVLCRPARAPASRPQRRPPPPARSPRPRAGSPTSCSPRARPAGPRASRSPRAPAALLALGGRDLRTGPGRPSRQPRPLQLRPVHARRLRRRPRRRRHLPGPRGN